MNVKLIWITPNVAETIEYCARVSNPENQAKMDSGEIKPGRLMNYLIRNKHWSPFEMASACLEINTTRDIGRQILRHRSFSFQEFSQRYAKTFSEVPLREMRLRALTNRQGSIEEGNTNQADFWRIQAGYAYQHYEELLNKGIAPECARAILPEGYTPTRMYMAGTIRSWIHYLEVRTDSHTQKEHRELAEEIRQVLLEAAPGMSEVFQ